MRIAIDLNDVIRDYTDNFIKEYLINYNREYDTSSLSLWTNDMEMVLPFKTKRAYEKFVYEDYSFELFGRCNTCNNKVSQVLDEWLKSVKELECDEDIEVMFVSTMEFGNTIGYTYFFISKLGTSIREVYLPTDSLKIWDRCDVLITANPYLLKNKPENKKSIKIEKEYNVDIDIKSDYTYKSFNDFAKDENNTIILFENE